MSCWQKVVLFIFHLAWSSPVFANYFFQHYTVSQGLPSNAIQCFYKDRYGLLWIGTANGLSQYDGYAFRNFLHNPNDSNSLPNNNVHSITEDQQGRLWFGLWGGVATFNPQTQQFKSVRLPFEQNYDKVLHIFCDSKNRIWISTTSGNYLFSVDGQLIKHWKAGKGPHDLPHNAVVFTQEDKSGNIWISGRCGLCRFREATMDFEIIPDNNPPYVENNAWLNSVNEGSIASDGILWYGSWANGLRRIDPKTKNYKTWLTKPEFTGHGAYNVISGTTEFDGKIWVASHDQGLGYLDETLDKLQFLKDLPIQGYDMPVKKVNLLLADGPVLWIGTPHGMYKYDRRKQLFEVFKVPDLKTGSCLPEIQSVSQLNQNELLLCTWTCGLFQFQQKEVKAFHRKPGLFINPKDQTFLDIKQVTRENDSTFWYATSHGLIVESGRRSMHIRPGGFTNEMIGENYFYKTMVAQNGTIWAGTGNGILKIDPKTWTFQKLTLSNIAPAFATKTSDVIFDISEAPNGDIWFLRNMGGDDYVLGFTVLRKNTNQWVTYVAGKGKFKNYPYPQSAYHLKACSDGHIFVTGERGLVQFSGTHPGDFISFSSYNGLAADACYGLEEDAFGTLWVAGSGSLSALNLKSQKWKTFTAGDGLPDASIESLSKIGDGHIAIGHNAQWLTVLKPERLRLYQTKDQQFKFTHLEVGDKKLWPADSVLVPTEANFLRLSFSPLDFLSSLDQAFQVVIRRAGQESRYQTPSNEITLSDLQPGWYEIKVSAPGLKTIDFHFYKQPRFWQTTWFLVISIVLAFSLVTAILLIRQRQLLRKREEERSLQFQMADMQMTALRSQIDAHFIFNALNAINQFIWQKLPEQAADYLTQFARLMRINLEHTRSDWVSLADELHAVEYYFNLESLTLDNPPQLVWEVDNLSDKAELSIPPMLLQPIVENVFKHGFQLMDKPGVLHLRLEKVGDMLLFTARDNGPGPKDGGHTKGHQSLASKIMNERLALLNRKLGKQATFELTRELENSEPFTVARLLIPFQGFGEGD